MSLRFEDLHLMRECFPRVSGDEPLPVRVRAGRRPFSPRERG